MLADMHGGEMAAWADILSRIGEKNSRLYELLARDAIPRHAPVRSAGRMIVEELERERSRIARELHAGAGQPLAGIKLNLEMLDSCATDLPPAGRDALTRLQTLTEQALQQVRAVSHNLHPPDWQALSVDEALRQLVRSSGLGARIEVNLSIAPLPAEPSHAVKVALYRSVQACISNVVRHSGATCLSISLAPVGDCPAGPAVELRVEDNGRGLPVDSAAGKGIGLKSLREHAEDFGGSCDVTSSPSGVSIRIQLPLFAD